MSTWLGGGAAAPRALSDRAPPRPWRGLPIYARLERVVVAALCNLVAEVFTALVRMGAFDASDHAVFQRVFGMIFIAIVALERSIVVAAERHDGIVQVKVVIRLAMLAVVRKVSILDFPSGRPRNSSVSPRRSWRLASTTGSCATTTPRKPGATADGRRSVERRWRAPAARPVNR